MVWRALPGAASLARRLMARAASPATTSFLTYQAGQTCQVGAALRSAGERVVPTWRNDHCAKLAPPLQRTQNRSVACRQIGANYHTRGQHIQSCFRYAKPSAPFLVDRVVAVQSCWAASAPPDGKR